MLKMNRAGFQMIRYNVWRTGVGARFLAMQPSTLGKNENCVFYLVMALKGRLWGRRSGGHC